jgi:hypothetical protein
MMRPKKKPPKSAEPEMKTLGVRMTVQYADWLERFAKSQRRNAASMIDRALADAAEKEEFEAPPERVP